MIKMKDVFGID